MSVGWGIQMKMTWMTKMCGKVMVTIPGQTTSQSMLDACRQVRCIIVIVRCIIVIGVNYNDWLVCMLCGIVVVNDAYVCYCGLAINTRVFLLLSWSQYDLTKWSILMVKFGIVVSKRKIVVSKKLLSIADVNSSSRLSKKIWQSLTRFRTYDNVITDATCCHSFNCSCYTARYNLDYNLS